MSLWLSPVIAIALVAAPDAPAVRMQLASPLPCELGTGIGAAFAEQQITVATPNEAGSWELAVQAAGEAISVRLTNPQGALRGLRRLTPTKADCPTLPRSVALLVKSWLGMQLKASATAPTATAPPTTAPPTTAPMVSAPTATAPPATAPSATAPPATAPVEDTPRSAGAELALPTSAEFFVARPEPLRPRSGAVRSFSAMLAGGGAFGVDDQPVGMGMLAIEWAFFEPWGVAIDAGLQTERLRTQDGGGSVSGSLRWASLGLRRAFFAEGTIRGLHLSVGVQLVHLRAAARGFVTNAVIDVFMPAAAAHLEWRQPIAAGFFFLARLDVQARLRPQSFSVGGIAVLTVPAWGFGVAGGVGWNFR